MNISLCADESFKGVPNGSRLVTILKLLTVQTKYFEIEMFITVK